MKKILQIIAAISFGFLAITTPAAAAQDCVMENTGEGSVNVCTNTTSVTCTVNNNNTVTFTNTNNQQATTGAATGSGNTVVYPVTSGDASNDNQSSVSLTVTNPGVVGQPDSGGSCVLTTVTRTPVEPPVTPQPNVPVTTAAAPAPTPAPVPSVLPKTSAGSPLILVGAGTALLALIAVISRSVILFQTARNK